RRFISILWADTATIHQADVKNRPPNSPMRSSAILAASWAGGLSLRPWQKRWQAAQAGGSSLGLSAWVGWSTSGRQTTRTALQELLQSVLWICTSTPIISILARKQPPTSIR